MKELGFHKTAGNLAVGWSSIFSTPREMVPTQSRLMFCKMGQFMPCKIKSLSQNGESFWHTWRPLEAWWQHKLLFSRCLCSLVFVLQITLRLSSKSYSQLAFWTPKVIQEAEGDTGSCLQFATILLQWFWMGSSSCPGVCGSPFCLPYGQFLAIWGFSDGSTKGPGLDDLDGEAFHYVSYHILVHFLTPAFDLIDQSDSGKT